MSWALLSTAQNRVPLCGVEGDGGTGGPSSLLDCSTLPSFAVPPDWEQLQCPEDLEEEHLVPIQIHTTIDAQGNPAISQRMVDFALEELNANFAPGNFIFYSAGPISIANDPSLNDLNTNEKYNRFRELSPPRAKAINYYLPSTSGFIPSGSSPFSPATFTDVNMSVNTFRGQGGTREHETGHAMGLYHTFKSTTDPGQSHISCSGLPTGANVDRFELVTRVEDQSLPFPFPNCQYTCADDSPYMMELNAGDLVCDTPADPYRGDASTSCLVDNTSCIYVGTIPGPNNTMIPMTDLNGQEYTPDVSNFMSYYNCRSSFTQGQFDRMLYFFLNSNAFPAPDCKRVTVAHSEDVIRMPNPTPVNNVDVYISNFADGNCMGLQAICDPIFPTDAQGVFKCLLTDQGNNQATLTKEDDWTSGISTYDLVLMSKHILGVEALDGWQQIAADVNGNGEVTAVDMVEVRKIILVLSDAFPVEGGLGGPWLFFPEQIPSKHPKHLDKEYMLDPFDMPAPFSHPDYLLDDFCYPAAPLAQGEGGFHAVKIGDVNGNANTQNLTGGNSSDRGQSIIEVRNDRLIKAGEAFVLQLSASNFKEVVAYGLGFYLDTEQVSLEAIEEGDLPYFQMDNFGTQQLEQKELRTLWMDEKMEGQTLNATQNLFQLRLRALRDIDQIQSVIQLNEGVMAPEYYNQSLAPVPVQLQMTITSPEEQNLTVYQNNFAVAVFPNPVDEAVHFQFQSTQRGSALIRFYDALGQRIFEAVQAYDIGDNILRIDDLPQKLSGTLFYTIEADHFQQHGKFVKIR